MKTAFGVISILALAGTAGPAFAGLEVCNKSGQTAYVAVGYPDGDKWVAEGWWEVGVADCTTVLTGDLSSRYYYVRGEGVDDLVWEGDHYFCTTSTKFTLVDDTECESGTVTRKAFFQVDTGDSRDWTTNLLDE